MIEKISIDEACLDVSGCEGLFGSAVTIGRAIKRRIRDEVGLIASVGVAPNKFLAKLASDLEKPDGFVVVKAGEAEPWLADLSVGRIWGIGRVAQEALARLGIHKVRDLRSAPVNLLERHFGAHAAGLIELARGIDDRPVVPDSEAKSIGAETTFAVDIADAEDLERRIDRLVGRVARRLRRNR